MTTLSQPMHSVVGQPTWEIAELFPAQGEWTEAEYLGLQTNRLIELSDGRLEFLPMPTTLHQLVVDFLFSALKAFVVPRGLGLPLFAPLRMRLWTGKFREPDILFMLKDHQDRVGKYWGPADLVMEVVSPKNVDHDRRTKRIEYAAARIPEYWIVDVIARHVLVLVLDNDEYVVHGQFVAGQSATSKLLDGFSVNVDDILAVADQAPDQAEDKDEN